MKQKELKNLAKKIAKLETIIQASADENEINKATTEIMVLTGKVHSFEELDLLDEMVQEILQQNS